MPREGENAEFLPYTLLNHGYLQIVGVGVGVYTDNLSCTTRFSGSARAAGRDGKMCLKFQASLDYGEPSNMRIKPLQRSGIVRQFQTAQRDRWCR